MLCESVYRGRLTWSLELNHKAGSNATLVSNRQYSSRTISSVQSYAQRDAVARGLSSGESVTRPPLRRGSSRSQVSTSAVVAVEFAASTAGKPTYAPRLADYNRNNVLLWRGASSVRSGQPCFYKTLTTLPFPTIKQQGCSCELAKSITNMIVATSDAHDEQINTAPLEIIVQSLLCMATMRSLQASQQEMLHAVQQEIQAVKSDLDLNMKQLQDVLGRLRGGGGVSSTIAHVTYTLKLLDGAAADHMDCQMTRLYLPMYCTSMWHTYLSHAHEWHAFASGDTTVPMATNVQCPSLALARKMVQEFQHQPDNAARLAGVLAAQATSYGNTVGTFQKAFAQQQVLWQAQRDCLALKMKREAVKDLLHLLQQHAASPLVVGLAAAAASGAPRLAAAATATFAMWPDVLELTAAEVSSQEVTLLDAQHQAMWHNCTQLQEDIHQWQAAMQGIFTPTYNLL